MRSVHLGTSAWPCLRVAFHAQVGVTFSAQQPHVPSVSLEGLARVDLTHVSHVTRALSVGLDQLSAKLVEWAHTVR